MELRRNRDRERLLKLHEQLINEAKSYCKQHPLTFSAQQIKTYSTIGGTPFLDNQYTVFGEVVEGLDVVERIQQAKTNRSDRPINDISMTMEVIYLDDLKHSILHYASYEMQYSYKRQEERKENIFHFLVFFLAFLI